MPEVKILDVIMPFRCKHFPLDSIKLCSKLAVDAEWENGRDRRGVHLTNSYQ